MNIANWRTSFVLPIYLPVFVRSAVLHADESEEFGFFCILKSQWPGKSWWHQNNPKIFALPSPLQRYIWFKIFTISKIIFTVDLFIKVFNFSAVSNCLTARTKINKNYLLIRDTFPSLMYFFNFISNIFRSSFSVWFLNFLHLHFKTVAPASRSKKVIPIYLAYFSGSGGILLVFKKHLLQKNIRDRVDLRFFSYFHFTAVLKCNLLFSKKKKIFPVQF